MKSATLIFFAAIGLTGLAVIIGTLARNWEKIKDALLLGEGDNA